MSARTHSPVVAAAIQPEALPAALRGRIGYLLNRPALVIRMRAQKLLKPLQLIPPQFAVLAILEQAGPRTQKALGEMLKADPATMVWMIDRLEKEGFVRRGKHPKDRRAHLVEITGRGRAVHARAGRRLDQLDQEFLQPLSPGERQNLRRLLSKLFWNVPTHGLPAKLFEQKHG